MKFGWRHEIAGDWEKSSRLEWLEANGLGGYASSSVSGANTRRYHGLLVPATRPPVGRMVLLSRLDETIIAGEKRIDLASSEFPGAIHPQGFTYLRSFRRDLFPVFEYAAEGIRLRKTIVAIHDENTTVVLYELLEAPSGITIELRPFVAARDYHGEAHANPHIRRDAIFDRGTFSYQAYDGTPTLYIEVPGSEFESQPDWYYNFEYAIERERGFEGREDLFTPGVLRAGLPPGATLAVIASTENPRGRDGAELLAEERRRRERLIRAAGATGRLSRALVLAADQFIVRRSTDRRTVIAGYHWFADWGRDTMIALPGLCLVTGRFDDARQILLAFAESVSQGMLPNRFPDSGEEPEYNTVDATPWFFVAAYQYLHYSGDAAFVKEKIFPVFEDILQWHERGTRHNIHVDSDGLLSAGASGVQLTWMDAKVGDWVVTPRHGKAVEINALWYNALLILAEFRRMWSEESAARELEHRAAQVRARFQHLFWNQEGGFLYDVVNGEERDATMRPNQIFAISLPFQILDESYAIRVLAAVEAKLFTLFGLRSLAPDDPRFHGTYIGGPAERDSVYHQGTVWSWLLGPYITALVRVRRADGKTQGRRILEEFSSHLGEAAVGTISEIFDATAPFAPRGCCAQAWSVGEILRTMREDLDMIHPPATKFRRLESRAFQQDAATR